MHCLDLFIYLSPEGTETFVGIVMHGRTPTVEYYRSEDIVSTASGRGVVFGHLTCDVSVSGPTQLNILIYDGIPEDSLGAEVAVRDRYAWVQSLQGELEQNRMGLANMVVQWMGCPSTHAKIRTMSLPHEKSGIALVGSDQSYSVYAFQEDT